MKKILYLGTSSPPGKEVLHYPVIRLIPKKAEEVADHLKKLSLFSHCLFTSKNSVAILWDLSLQLGIDPSSCLQGKCVSIGSSTSAALRYKGIEPSLEALISTQEGLIASLEDKLVQDSYVFYPRSSLARPLLAEYLLERGVAHEVLDLYDTIYQQPGPKPSFEEIEEIVFTSPSTVDGFFKIFETIPSGIRVSFQGPITQKYFCKKSNLGLINF